MYENLFNLIDDLQKAAMKIKVQEVSNTLCTDERVHEILDADIMLEYYEKMHKHFEKNPKDFLFPIDVDVIILGYVHRNLKNWRPERSKIWIIDFVEAFKKLQEKLNEEKN